MEGDGKNLCHAKKQTPIPRSSGRYHIRYIKSIISAELHVMSQQRNYSHYPWKNYFASLVSHNSTFYCSMSGQTRACDVEVRKWIDSLTYEAR
jgi:hypothetical protein